MTYQIKFIIPFFREINTYQVDSVESTLEAKPCEGIHVSVTFEMIRLIIWQVCSAELQGFHVSVTLSNHVLKVSNSSKTTTTTCTVAPVWHCLSTLPAV